MQKKMYLHYGYLVVNISLMIFPRERCHDICYINWSTWIQGWNKIKFKKALKNLKSDYVKTKTKNAFVTKKWILKH